MDKSVATTKSYPRLLENITDYDDFSCQEVDDCIRVADSIRDKAFGLGGLQRKSSDFSDEQLKTELNQIEKAHAIAEKSLTGKNTDLSEASSGKETVRTSKLLPDNRKIADLNINSSFLNQIYETAQQLAKDRYYDAQLSSFTIAVFPFATYFPRVAIYLGFFSALAGRTCSYKVSDLNLQVEHCPPDKEARDDLEKKVLKNLPWEESPDWKQFLQISIAKTGPLPPNDMTRYVLSANPWGIVDLGKTDVFWNVSLTDNFSGKEHVFRWNGQKIDAHNIKQDY